VGKGSGGMALRTSPRLPRRWLLKKSRPAAKPSATSSDIRLRLKSRSIPPNWCTMTQISPDTVDDAWLARSRQTVARTNLVPQAESVGRVERVGDGIALVSGLPDVRLNELLRFDGGRMGFALTLDADSISAVLLD